MIGSVGYTKDDSASADCGWFLRKKHHSGRPSSGRAGLGDHCHDSGDQNDPQMVSRNRQLCYCAHTSSNVMAHLPDHMAEVFISDLDDDEFAWIERLEPHVHGILIRTLDARTGPGTR